MAGRPLRSTGRRSSRQTGQPIVVGRGLVQQAPSVPGPPTAPPYGDPGTALVAAAETSMTPRASAAIKRPNSVILGPPEGMGVDICRQDSSRNNLIGSPVERQA